MKQLVWCKLKNGNSQIDAYLEFKSKMRVGVKVTLKDSEDPTIWWTVESMGEPIDAELVERKENWYKTNFTREDGVFTSKSWNKSS
jgi:hypothetical protein